MSCAKDPAAFAIRFKVARINPENVIEDFTEHARARDDVKLADLPTLRSGFADHFQGNWMGQANYTGKLPQDVLDSVEKQLTETDDLRRLINLPDDADFLGYLIFDGETEEFLYKEASSLDKPTRVFSKVPHRAFRFKSYAEANRQAHRDNGESIVALFDLGKEQLLVAQLSDDLMEHSFAVH